MTTHHRDQQFLARLRLVSLQALGVSVGPFRSDKDARDVASFLNYFGTITLRDTASRERLDDLGVRANVYQGFDIGVLLPDVPFVADAISAHREVKGTRKRLGVSICNYEVLGQGNPGDEDVRRERLLRLLRRISESADVSFRFLVFNSHARRGEERLLQSYAEELSSHAPTEVVPYSGDVRRTLKTLANCDAVLGMRLHSAVFAYALGVPFAMIAYHPKCLDFAAEVGLPDHLVLPSVGPEDHEHATHIISNLLFEPGAQDQPRLPLSMAKHLARRALELGNGAHNAAGNSA